MNRKSKNFALVIAATSLLLLALSNPTFAQTPLFGPQTEYAAASKNGPSGIAVGDFNGDGKPDLAVVNFGDWNIYILLGNGDGTFQAARSVYFASGGGFPWYVVAADFNGDGKLDLAVSNYGDNSISVLLGNGDGTFQPPQTTTVGTNPAKVAVGDFNNDGKLDLVVSSVGSNTVSVMLGKGDGTFLPPVVTPVGANPWYFTVGDFNGDGKLDLAVSDYGCPLDCNSSPSSTVTVLLGNGDGTFLPAPNLTVGNGPAGIATADFNGDGKPDLAVCDLNDNTVSILLGNGDGTFQAPHTFSDPGLTHPYYIDVGDFNRDGKQGLVIANELGSATIGVLLGNGDGTFQAAQVFAVDSDPVFAAVHDFNGDGAPDLAVANLHSLNISVLLNSNNSASPVATPAFSPAGGTYTGSVTVTISDATSGATIYYTTDGSTPTTSSTVYAGPLTFNQTTTLNAMAAASGMSNSAVASATYTVQQQQQVATPAFSPGGGTYTGSVTVTISDATSGATIYYTTDGSTPTTSSTVYAGPLTFNHTTTLNAVAAASGMSNSGVGSATYTVVQPAATPTFSPGGGTYTGSVTVTISDATSGATIYYTTDGSTPTTSSTVYAGALTFNHTTTLNAMAAASGMSNSGVASATYTVVQPAAMPTFSPGGGTYTGSVTVTISDATSGATIYYTTDGSTPTTSSAVYAGALTFTHTTTLKAMAAASGMSNSGVASATYAVVQPAATPTFSPGGGTYVGSVTVTISDATSGATIYYTTNGSTPTTSSAVYTGPLTFTQTTTLKAMAAGSGLANSAVASATYTILLNLTVDKTDLGGGTVTSSPGGINCGSTCSNLYAGGTTVKLTATPGLLSGFGGWSGCDSVSGNTCTVKMNAARSVTADFKLLGLL